MHNFYAFHAEKVVTFLLDHLLFDFFDTEVFEKWQKQENIEAIGEKSLRLHLNHGAYGQNTGKAAKLWQLQ